MAKAGKNDGEVQEQQLQQPEPPPKKKKKGLSLPLIIGISFAALLILIGGTLGAVYLMVNNMMQHTNTEQTSDANNHEENADEEENADNHEFDLEAKYADLQNIVEKQKKNIQFMELGEIITNPKNSNKFVVIDIGVEYVAYNENGEVIKTGEEGAEEVESPEDFFAKRDLAKVRSIVNQVVWSNSEIELQDKRSELPEILKDDFKEIFLQNGAIIKDVIVLRFIIQ